MQYDLIILGSGSVGAAAGYYARKAGLNVLMTDAHMPPHHEGSHHGDTRLMRHAYGEGEKYVPLVLRAQALWDELAAVSRCSSAAAWSILALLIPNFCAPWPTAPHSLTSR